uniref:Uncharacterized protein n=1 Tax=Anguilla anguilla TaxID=7936 RepID=A0A0E9RRQ8_ANGAN
MKLPGRKCKLAIKITFEDLSVIGFCNTNIFSVN